MISPNVICTKLLLSLLNAKKEKNIIYASKWRKEVETIPNNAFVIFVIFKNNVVSIQQNNIRYIIKTLIFKNSILDIKNYLSSIYQKVNNLKLIFLKLYHYFYRTLCQTNTFYTIWFFITKINYWKKYN